MPIPTTSAPAPPRAVALPVLCHHGPTARKSRMGPRRAAILIIVNLAIIAHVCFWYFGGKKPTLSPVEPSESMYTINNGELNAGFVFFAVAILATIIFGRFFCGWGCHVVALQDLCGWFMKKCGVHPKPFRSKLLLFAPVILAFYMFLWPTFKREVVRPIAGAHWQTIVPYIGGEPPPRPQLKAAFVKADFWETFATWSSAIPFLAVCGFACVYFLGAKGFCSYGCPYGGIFAPVDAISPGRIRVTDACEHCGHCTAVCTSNVRVHEEVRDWGMVMDPGCMKCMDCVSVCPNDALYFGYGAPSLFARARVKNPVPRFGARLRDLAWPGEILAGLLFLALVLSYRGMLEMVPLLMAMGMAGVGTFLLFKTVAIIREPSVRLQSLQLKLKGRLRPAGLATILLAVLMLSAAAWSGTVNASVFRADIVLHRVNTPVEDTFKPGFAPDASTRAAAESARRNLRRADLPTHGGIGWKPSTQHLSNLAYVNLVLGDYPAAEQYMLRAIYNSGERGPGQEIIRALGPTIGLQQGRLPTDVIKTYEEILAAKPLLTDARMSLAHFYALSGQPDQTISHVDRAVADNPDDFATISQGAQFMINIRRLDRAAELLRRSLEIQPSNSQNHLALGVVLANSGQPEQALEALKTAATLDPRNAQLQDAMAQLYRALGREAEAQACEQRAEETRRLPPPSTPDLHRHDK